MKRLDVSEVVFRLISYIIVTLFALATLYPLIYILSYSLSDVTAMSNGSVVLLPKNFNNFVVYKVALKESSFWIAYCNTIFYTFFGTIVSMFISITGAYALSKTKLLYRRTFNFLLVLTMWFKAGLVPEYLNYIDLGIDSRWGIIFGLGLNVFNIILLRNAFSGVPSEIEEAAIIDGANEFQVLTKVYMPMSTASIATVTLFYAISRWNGYFWANWLLKSDMDKPLMVYIKNVPIRFGEDFNPVAVGYTESGYMYALIVCSIIPILCVYPYLSRFFSKGVNVGGVKE